MQMEDLKRAKQTLTDALKAIAEYDAQGATQLTTTFTEMFFVISQLQVALRCPENKGLSADATRNFIERVSANMGAYNPVIKEAIDYGNEPQPDVTDEELEELFKCS